MWGYLAGPALFANGARLFLEMEPPGSIWKLRKSAWLYLEMELGSIWKWSPALFGHLDMELGFIWK